MLEFDGKSHKKGCIIMPMQVTLDELLGMLVSRVEDLAVDMESQKSRFNVMFRMLYRRGLFTEADALDAIRDENRILLELGLIKAMPDEAALKAAAENLMLWIKGDVPEIHNMRYMLPGMISMPRNTAPTTVFHVKPSSKCSGGSISDLYCSSSLSCVYLAIIKCHN